MFGNINESFDLIVCNPPYIPRDELFGLQREVKCEPQKALNGGRDGLDFYRVLACDASGHINKGGTLLMEVGFDQAGDVLKLFGKGHAVRDLNGVERVVAVEW